ncbi:MAG: helix-turn-helix domain-containing protein [Chloroflexota bacterium]|nr:helix-turn-helix domain-containing protein [Chloroflexota bacterium]
MAWLTVEKVARRLDRSEQLVRRWLREGRLRGQLFGRSWMVQEREIERFHRHEPRRRKNSG